MRELLTAVGMSGGTKVFVTIPADLPTALLLIPQDMIERWVDLGREAAG